MNGKQQKTCFVISPIGPEESEVRKVADDFLELLVEPALEKYSFQVIRGDKIANSSAITSDIVRLVQESDLCIIDLTNNNPNVFYECGRRHETGKPFIQMVRKGDEVRLPFDVSGIRTLSYDLSNPRALIDSKKKLQDFIDVLVSTGFDAKTSGESLSSVAQALERIERKMNTLLAAPSQPQIAAETSDDGETLFELFLPPKTVFINALKKGQIERAMSLLPKLEKTLERREYVTYLGFAAMTGDPKAFELLDSALNDILVNPSLHSDVDELLQAVAQSFHSRFTNTGEFKDGVKYFDDMLPRILASTGISGETKAFIANKVGMLAWSGHDFMRCIQATKLAVDLNPEPSYLYNLGLVYQQTEMMDDLQQTLGRLSKMGNLDSDHKRLLKKHGFLVP